MPADIYVKFDGIEGDSQDALNKGWIEVDNMSFGFAMPTSPERSALGAATTGKVEATVITLAKTMDTASMALMRSVWRGDHIPKVEFKFYRAHQGGRICYMRVELTDVVISGVQLSGMNQTGLPGESFSLSYGSILVEYTPTEKTKGGAQPKPLRASLNRITNVKS